MLAMKQKKKSGIKMIKKKIFCNRIAFFFLKTKTTKKLVNKNLLHCNDNFSTVVLFTGIQGVPKYIS